MGKKRGRNQITSYVEDDLKNKITTAANLRNMTVSEVVADCCYNQLQDEAAWDILWKRLSRMDNRMNEIKDLVITTSEAVSMLAFYFFAQTPEIPVEEGEEALNVANRRHERYVNAVSKILSSRGGFIEKMKE